MCFVDLEPSFVYIYHRRWRPLISDSIENVTGSRDWFDCTSDYCPGPVSGTVVPHLCAIL